MSDQQMHTASFGVKFSRDPKMYTVNVGVRFNLHLIRFVGRVLAPLARLGLVDVLTAKRLLMRLVRYRINGGPWRRFKVSQEGAA